MKLIKSAVLSTMLVTSSLMAAEVLATVNGKTINKSDVNKILRTRHMSFDKLTQAEQKKILDNLIDSELLAEIAFNSGVEKDPEYAKFVDNYKKYMATKVWQDKIYKRTLISDSEANKYYQEHKEQYKSKARVHARHILVKSENEAKDLIAELSKLKGEELKKKFIELAKSKSTGPSGKNGGDLGYFTPGQMVKPFNDAAFAMNIGEITKEPVKTQFGYHVIYLEDKKPEGFSSFEEVKDKIIRKMRRNQFNKTIKESIEKAKKSAKITLNVNLKDNNSSK